MRQFSSDSSFDFGDDFNFGDASTPSAFGDKTMSSNNKCSNHNNNSSLHNNGGGGIHEDEEDNNTVTTSSTSGTSPTTQSSINTTEPYHQPRRSGHHHQRSTTSSSLSVGSGHSSMSNASYTDLQHTTQKPQPRTRPSVVSSSLPLPFHWL